LEICLFQNWTLREADRARNGQSPAWSL
jgi:hypothetical protein